MAKGDEPIQPLGRGEKAAKPEQEVQNLVEEERRLEKSIQGQKQSASLDALDQIARQLPRLIQRTLAKLEASTVYQTFKLPGRDYVVRDQRDQEEHAKTLEKRDPISEESKKPLKELLVQQGKIIETKEKTYQNYLGGASGHAPMPEQQAAHKRLTQFF